MGIWINRNDKVLIVVGLALVLGGSPRFIRHQDRRRGRSTSYSAKSPANHSISSRSENSACRENLLAFQPDTRTIGAALGATENGKRSRSPSSWAWSPRGPGAEGRRLSGVENQRRERGGHRTATPAQKKINLGLSVGFNKGSLANLKVGVGAVITDNNVTGGNIDARSKHGSENSAAPSRATTRRSRALRPGPCHSEARHADAHRRAGLAGAEAPPHISSASFSFSSAPLGTQRRRAISSSAPSALNSACWYSHHRDCRHRPPRQLDPVDFNGLQDKARDLPSLTLPIRTPDR